MNDTASKLSKLLETKAAIKQAIVSKGVEVGDDVVFADYPNKISEITSGEGGGDSTTYVNPDFYEIRTSGGTNYSYLFYNYNGTSLDIGNWDTSNVTDMDSMFYYCTNLTSLDLSNFDTSNVTNMQRMFNLCNSLEILNLSNFDTNKVTNMSSMLNCNKLHTLRLDNCNNDTISKIITSPGFQISTIDGVTRKIFVKAENVGDLTAPTNWIFVDSDGNEIVPEPEIPYIVATFGTDESVVMLGEPSSSWKASFDNGTTWEDNDMNMTKGNEIVYLKPKDSSIKIYRLFENSSYVTHIELHNFSDYPVYPYADYMFSNCSNLTELDLSSLNLSNGMNNLEGMFSNCNNLESLNLSSWSLGDETETSNMFEGCNSLHILRLDNCSNDTIRKLITSQGFPTGDIGVARQIFVIEDVSDLTEPDGWDFVNAE